MSSLRGLQLRLLSFRGTLQLTMQAVCLGRRLGGRSDQAASVTAPLEMMLDGGCSIVKYCTYVYIVDVRMVGRSAAPLTGLQIK